MEIIYVERRKEYVYELGSIHRPTPKNSLTTAFHVRTEGCIKYILVSCGQVSKHSNQRDGEGLGVKYSLMQAALAIKKRIN